MMSKAGILALLVMLSAPRAWAEAPSEDRKSVAEAAFERGVELMNDGATEAALSEFLHSRELHPTRGNTQNAAVCLRKLGRYDEALDLFEVLLVDFPEALEDAAQIQREIAYLKGLVGNIVPAVNQPGAVVVVDGRERGVTPITQEIRVAAGSHQVHVKKPGFWPFDTRVEVAGRQDVRVVVDLKPVDQPRPPPAAPVRDVRPQKVAPSAPAISSVGLDVAGLWAPGHGGELRDGCDAGCDAGPALGGMLRLRGAHRFGSVVEVGASVGFVGVRSVLDGRSEVAQPAGLPDVPGTARDELTETAIVLVPHVGVRLGDFLLGRLGAGVSFGRIAMRRSGSFGGADAARVETSDGTRRALLVPELGAHWPVAKNLELGAGAGALLGLSLGETRWPASTKTIVGGTDEATYPTRRVDTELSAWVFVSVGAQYAF